MCSSVRSNDPEYSRVDLFTTGVPSIYSLQGASNEYDSSAIEGYTNTATANKVTAHIYSLYTN